MKAGTLVLKSIGIWIVVGSVSVWGTTFQTLSQCYLKTNYICVCARVHTDTCAMAFV